MNRRSFFLLPLALRVIFSAAQLSMVAHGTDDDHEEFRYWCPTGKMIDEARAQHAKVQETYEVSDDYDFDV